MVAIRDVVMQIGDVVAVGLGDPGAARKDPRIPLHDIVFDGDILHHVIPPVANPGMGANTNGALANIVKGRIDDSEIGWHALDIPGSRGETNPGSGRVAHRNTVERHVLAAYAVDGF